MCSSKSPVDVENFTLNEEIVRKHQEIAQRWQEVGESITTLKSERRYNDLLVKLEESQKMLAEIGAEDSPMQCDVMLLLEEAQAYFNLSRFAEAEEKAISALKILDEVPQRHKDLVRIAEVKELVGYIALKSGDVAKAEKMFGDLLAWIDGDGKSAAPMVTVAIKNMRRTVVTGVGMCLVERATESGDKAKFDKALDTLIEGLNAHIEESDFAATKMTLDGALRCFVGLGDKKQAIETCEKYISWCKRHDDVDGVALGEQKLQQLKQ